MNRGNAEHRMQTPHVDIRVGDCLALLRGRSAILLELNPDYAAMARKRCNVTPGLAL